MWLQKAASQGYNRSRFALAQLYQLGRGVEQSDEKAKELMRTAIMEPTVTVSEDGKEIRFS